MKELKIEIPIPVRFSDTDAMGVVWHGNYLKFFEDAREAFGNKYGLTYLDIYQQGFFTPVVKSNIDHKSPVYFGQEVKAIARLVPSASAKIVFEYEIINLTTSSVSAVGKTTQVFLRSTERILELHKPAFYEEWEKKRAL